MAKYVVTSKPLQAQWNNSNVIDENVVKEVTRLKQQPGKNILIEGSATLVEALAQADVVDEYKLLIQPTLMRNGKRFFKDGTGMSKLELVEGKPISKGVLLLSYVLAR